MWVFDGEQWNQDDEEQGEVRKQKRHIPEVELPLAELEVLEIIPVPRPSRSTPPPPM